MIFNKGMIVRHKDYKDVAFRVSAAINNAEHYEVFGHWINQGYEKSWVIRDGMIQVDKKDLRDWLFCLEPEAKCIRNEKWLRL